MNLDLDQFPYAVEVNGILLWYNNRADALEKIKWAQDHSAELKCFKVNRVTAKDY